LVIASTTLSDRASTTLSDHASTALNHQSADHANESEQLEATPCLSLLFAGEHTSSSVNNLVAFSAIKMPFFGSKH
jgi:hypothetical protein